MKIFIINRIKFLIIMIIIISFSTFLFVLNKDNATLISTIVNSEINSDECRRLIVTMLDENIEKAITDNYGGRYVRGYDLSTSKVRIKSLIGWSNFEVTIEVETFYGAHNPPYAIEKMTFKIELDNEPKLINYESIKE